MTLCFFLGGPAGDLRHQGSCPRELREGQQWGRHLPWPPVQSAGEWLRDLCYSRRQNTPSSLKETCVSLSSSTSCKLFCPIRCPRSPLLSPVPWETWIWLLMSEPMSVFWLASMPKAKRPHASKHHALTHTYTHMHREAYARTQTFLLMHAQTCKPTSIWHLGELKIVKQVDWGSNWEMVRPGWSTRGERCGQHQFFG